MLTADLVRVRKKGTELFVSELSSKQRPRALELARSYLGLAEACVGDTRAELEEAFAGVPTAASERKLALGLQKLVEDRLEFEVQSEIEPRELRADLFSRATAARKALAEGERLDRGTFLATFAAERNMSEPDLERALYADLRQAQVLQGFASLDPERLVEGYDLAQKQAVLLRAVDVIADVRCRDAYAYRVLFRKLKFYRLMHRIEPRADGGFRIHIDGPFSLFTASTKYGLELALCLPALLSCDEYTIRAALRWGKERTPLTFKLEGRASFAHGAREVALPDEVQQLHDRLKAIDSPWQVTPASNILEVRGVGLCVPDLCFENRETGEVAYLEVLGYWSREAVWRRVELARAGLGQRVLFAVSSRLRVSEEVLGDDVPSELYVYKGTLSPREILRRLSNEPG